MMIRPLGDSALTIQFGDEISLVTHRRIRGMCLRLQEVKIHGVLEWVPGYATLTVYYDPVRIRYGALRERLWRFLEENEDSSLPPARTVVIPVCYGGEWGPDLAEVARVHDLSEREVIEIHTEPTYLVYMLGFAWGFPYLGGMSPRIATPRLVTPRLRIPAGSVGIAGGQTGIYPFATPGGWRIIGRTDVKLVDLERNPATLLQMGDELRFEVVE